MEIATGKEVSIEYTLTLEDGSEVASNMGSEPLIFIQGDKQIVPGLEEALEGMKVGESKEVTVNPEKGFGELLEDAFHELELSQVPEEARKADARLQGRDDDGNIVNVRVAEVKEETVILDLNHPLAGKTLHFDVKILEIKEPSP